MSNSTCWHCSDTGYCPCLFCGLKCQACAGRKRTAAELELAERLRLDVQDTRNYALIHEGPYHFRRLKFPPGVAAA